MYLKIHKYEELIILTEYLKNTSPEWIAIDTEFHRESTYFPILSLVQVATQSQVWVIDALSCTDITPLKKILEDPSIKKIFHAGDQDWEILKQAAGAITWPFTDTQIMATFAKMDHSSSLESLALKLLNVSVDKSQQKTNWLQRPLQEEQLKYAASDAAYVAEIYPILNQKLTELDRNTWVDQEMSSLLQKYKRHPSKDWLKLCFMGCKWPVPFYALGLAKWREKWAKKLNVPKRYVIADALLDQALQSKSIKHINGDNCPEEAYKDLVKVWKNLTYTQSNQQEAYINKLQHAVNNHLQIFNLKQRSILKKWKAKVRNIAKQLELPAHYILNKQQLLQLVSGRKPTLPPWKKALFKKKPTVQ